MKLLESKAKLQTPFFDRRLYTALLTNEEKFKKAVWKETWGDREKVGNLSNLLSKNFINVSL